MLKPYYPDYLDRKSKIDEIIKNFAGKKEFKITLTTDLSLILSKDERGITGLRRYENSPFPLLSNIELFSCSIGEWNTDLAQYGIKARYKFNDPLIQKFSGSRIYLIRYHTPSSQGNRYLKRQYQRLHHLRSTLQIREY